MVAIRTPSAPKRDEKPSVQTERAGPSGPTRTTPDPSKNSKVRRSIEKLEAVGTHAPSRLSLTPKKPVDDVGKVKLKLVLPQTNRVERSPPKVTVKPNPVDRKAEAEACVKEIVRQLEKSKNINGLIKKEILGKADRLLELVKEFDLIKRSRPSLPPRVVNTATEMGVQTDTLDTLEEMQTVGKTDMECFSKRFFERLEEQTHLIRENTQKVEHLKEAIERQEKMSYASVAGLPKRQQQPDQTVLHSVVISAKDETETGEEIIQRIRTAVNAKAGGITVENIRKAKDRKVIVGCRTKEERDKVKERLKKTEDYLIVQEIKNKDPLIILKNVFCFNTNEDVLGALWAQNRKTLQDIDESQSKTEVLFRRKTRNPQTNHVVLRVSPNIWKRLVDAGSVMIDLQRITVADQSPLIQCSMCLGYGHGRRFCTDTVEKCSHCGGDHMRAICERWLSGGQPECINCMHTKQARADHNAFSNECVVRRKWEALARSTVAYC